MTRVRVLLAMAGLVAMFGCSGENRQPAGEGTSPEATPAPAVTTAEPTPDLPDTAGAEFRFTTPKGENPAVAYVGLADDREIRVFLKDEHGGELAPGTTGTVTLEGMPAPLELTPSARSLYLFARTDTPVSLPAKATVQLTMQDYGDVTGEAEISAITPTASD
jgi:hypothetical protein